MHFILPIERKKQKSVSVRFAYRSKKGHLLASIYFLLILLAVAHRVVNIVVYYSVEPIIFS